MDLHWHYKAEPSYLLIGSCEMQLNNLFLKNNILEELAQKLSS